jgi:hypothetical protein
MPNCMEVAQQIETLLPARQWGLVSSSPSPRHDSLSAHKGE